MMPVLRRSRSLIFALLLTQQVAAAIAISLQPSTPSPGQVGGIVTWTATPAVGGQDAYWYRFRVRRTGTPYRVWKDFGPQNTLDWTDADRPGTFEIEAAVRDRTTGAVSIATARYALQSNATADQPAVLPTSHPLVLLYSAPPCEAGARIKVRFQSADGFTQETPYKSCVAGSSISFYLAGLREQNEYFVYHVVDTGDSFEAGPVLTCMTGAVAMDLPATTVLTAPPASLPEPIVLQENVFASQTATDLAGRVVWYYPGNPLAFMTRPEGGGTFWGIAQDPQGDPWKQVLREFNLTGLAVRETNAGRVNEQLKALGKRSINAFHHEALRLPDGNIATLGGVEQVLSGVQGTGAVDVLGDMVIVLDQNLNVVWTWDTFDHLDVKRGATLGELCQPNACPPLLLRSSANDWTHANAIEAAPDGNLLVSIRNQDWIVKINYDSGEGNGDILWRLGNGGDFQLNSTIQNGWFSHQHDPRFEPLSTDRLMILDNGNVRHDTDSKANSRGQVYQLDEQAKTATLVFNADLGRYSLAVGSTERLSNGRYWFDNGFLPDASGVSDEVDSNGKSLFSVRTAAPVYRSYRLTDMYGPVRGTR